MGRRPFKQLRGSLSAGSLSPQDLRFFWIRSCARGSRHRPWNVTRLVWSPWGALSGCGRCLAHAPLGFLALAAPLALGPRTRPGSPIPGGGGAAAARDARLSRVSGPVARRSGTALGASAPGFDQPPGAGEGHELGNQPLGGMLPAAQTGRSCAPGKGPRPRQRFGLSLCQLWRSPLIDQ